MLGRFFSRFSKAKVNYYAPIPAQNSVAGWKEIPITECGEKLVPLGMFSEHTNIFSDAIYFGEGPSSPYKTRELNGSLITPFVREGVAKRLNHAASLLPEGHAFLMWDSFRPLSVQQALFDDYYNQLVKTGVDPDKAKVDAQRFVSIPSTDPTRPPPHNTGGAVDLTIVKFTPEAWAEVQELQQYINEYSKDEGAWQGVYEAEMRRLQLVHEATPLDMGTAFDQVAPETLTRFYEEKLEKGEALSTEDTSRLNNRRLFVNVMQAAGFDNYPEEWWHFDFGNQFAAKRTGEPAIYGAATLSVENSSWEHMRREHYLGNVEMQQTPAIYPAVKLSHQAPSFAEMIARKFPDIRPNYQPRAKKLEV